MARTVYVLAKGEPNAKPKPVQVKLGITDGAATEVIEGLNEGDQLVTSATAGDAGSQSRPAANPFGGGGFRRF